MVGDYSRGGEDGVGRVDECGAEDYGDRWGELRSGTLCDVWEGIRPSVSVCVADGAVCGDEWCIGCRDAGGGSGKADGARREGAERGREEGRVRRDQECIRRAG